MLKLSLNTRRSIIIILVFISYFLNAKVELQVHACKANQIYMNDSLFCLHPKTIPRRYAGITGNGYGVQSAKVLHIQLYENKAVFNIDIRKKNM
jgi:hypothetical protein